MIQERQSPVDFFSEHVARTKRGAVVLLEDRDQNFAVFKRNNGLGVRVERDCVDPDSGNLSTLTVALSPNGKLEHLLVGNDSGTLSYADLSQHVRFSTRRDDLTVIMTYKSLVVDSIEAIDAKVAASGRGLSRVVWGSGENILGKVSDPLFISPSEAGTVLQVSGQGEAQQFLIPGNISADFVPRLISPFNGDLTQPAGEVDSWRQLNFRDHFLQRIK